MQGWTLIADKIDYQLYGAYNCPSWKQLSGPVKQDDIILRNKGGVARIWTFIESHDKEGAKGQV